MKISLPIIDRVALQGHKYGACIEYLPTAWLNSIAAPVPTPTDMAELWRNLCTNGLRDPLVLGVGKDNTLRLDAGNHRVKLFAKYGIKALPVIAKVGATAILDPGNGLHCFKFQTAAQDIPVGTVVAPSKAVPSIRILNRFTEQL